VPKIVLCGIQEQGIEIVQYLIKNEVEICQLVTISKRMAKKSNASGWVSYEEFAKKWDIPIYYVESYSMRNIRDLEFFRKQRFDILILGGWQRLIPKSILDTLNYCGIGQHGSPEFLPQGRGRSPVNWAILQGKKRLIWHLFKLEEGIDNGDILDFEYFDINEYDTCRTVYYKVSVCVKHMLVRTIHKLLRGNGKILAYPQYGEPTYFSKRAPEDGKIDWHSSVYDVNNLIRAITHPYPGAFTQYNNEKILVWQAQVWDTKLPYYHSAKYGEIVEMFNDGNYVVKCRDGLLLVTDSEDKNVYLGKVYA